MKRARSMLAATFLLASVGTAGLLQAFNPPCCTGSLFGVGQAYTPGGPPPAPVHDPCTGSGGFKCCEVGFENAAGNGRKGLSFRLARCYITDDNDPMNWTRSNCKETIDGWDHLTCVVPNTGGLCCFHKKFGGDSWNQELEFSIPECTGPECP